MTREAVIDASVAVSFVVAGQATVATKSFDLGLWVCIAPNVLKYEVRHALRSLERRKLFPESAADLNLIAIEQEIAFADALTEAGFEDVMIVARGLNLGFYDACYVQLSLERGAALISRDGAIISAARAAGLETHDLR